MKTATSHRWLPLWINLLLLAIAIGMYAPFGLRGNFGLFEEFTARYGYLRTSVAIRFTTYWSFQFADWLAPDSFVGFNWLMIASFWLKGALMVGILRRLFPQQVSLAVVAGLLVTIYPADSGFMTLRSVAVHFVMACAMGAVYGVIRYWQKPHWAWWLWIVPLQVLAVAYEIHYPLFLLIPFIWLTRDISRRTVLLTLAWGMTPLILGLRALWLIQSGEGGYVSNAVNSANQNDPLTLGVAQQSLQALFERHLNSWQKGLELLDNTPYGVVAVVLGIASGLAVWVFYQPPALKWRHYVVIFIGGVALFVAAYGLFLPTIFRMDTFRVNIITTAGAAVAVGALLTGMAQVLRKLGRYWLAGWTVVLMTGGVAFQLDQAEHYTDLSANIQRLLGGIAAVAPDVHSDSVIVYVDRDYDYQSTVQLGGRSYIFEEAIQFIYDDQRLRAILCVPKPEPGRHSCTFTADELISIDDLGNEQRLPYDHLIVLHKGYNGQIQLLRQLPPDYLTPYGVPTHVTYTPMLWVNPASAPPDRVYSAFPCWPLEDCLEFPPVPTPTNSVRVEMDTPPRGMGWEPNDLASGLRWTTSTHATLHLDLATTEPLQVQFKVVYYVLPEMLDGLALMVNDVDIPLTQSVDTEAGWLYSGVIPAEVLAQNPYGLDETLVVIRTDRTISPKEVGLNEDTRQLGLLIDWVAVGPMTP